MGEASDDPAAPTTARQIDEIARRTEDAAETAAKRPTDSILVADAAVADAAATVLLVFRATPAPIDAATGTSAAIVLETPIAKVDPAPLEIDADFPAPGDPTAAAAAPFG